MEVIKAIEVVSIAVDLPRQRYLQEKSILTYLEALASKEGVGV
jgi:hypothetical protein